MKSRTDPCSEGTPEGEPGGGQTTSRRGAEPGRSREEVVPVSLLIGPNTRIEAD